MIDITGLDKRKVLCTLYNNAKPQGLGFLHFKNEDLTLEEAEKALAETDYFDYFNGRVMKVRIKADSNELAEHLYDRDNRPGAAKIAIDMIRKNVKV